LAAWAEAEAVIHCTLTAIPVAPLPDLGRTVLQRIEALSAPAASAPAASPAKQEHTFFRWLWRPRSISLQWRPAYGIAVAALVLVLVARGALPRSEAPVVSSTPQMLIQFRLSAPDARAVSLAGDFTNWKPTYAMTRTEPGVWTVVVPLAPGVHDYGFVVDGERWVPDPMAPAIDDGFGGVNSRLALLAPDAREGT
ncbi:MAG TPA: glycogen-binding domain-containing protein, partial [Longimicrobiales bacterium]|nr:glycogen-binding domain-containing protein [Longimicrobiales bacterium]